MRTLALFPGISILISVYGLVFEPEDIAGQIQVMAELLPPPAFALIEGRVHSWSGRYSAMPVSASCSACC